MRLLIFTAVWMLAAVGLSRADCIVSGPLPRLDSRAVEWRVVMASGRRCVRGVRSKAMLLDTVAISSPAKIGVVVVRGYGFSYQAPDTFKGEDSFTVSMAGTNLGIRGTSLIRVQVSVR